MTDNYHLSSYGLWVWDNQGHLEAINETAEYYGGVESKEIVGIEHSELIRSGLYDRSAVPDIFQRKGQAKVTSQSQRTGVKTINTGRPYFDSQNFIEHIVVYEHYSDGRLEEVDQTGKPLWNDSSGLGECNFESYGIIAENSIYKKVLSTSLKLAHTGVSNILILGETGTGKGLLANFIHKNSLRSDKPFIQINCAALPENLLEAELFGYEKGAFTGANSQGKAGLFELAHGGTLFLDEIGDLPLALQSKLLKYLDDYQVMRLGSTKPRKADCTIIAATNQDLELLVSQGSFRQDLYYRISPFVVNVPPLRERTDDIQRLIFYLLEKYNHKFKCQRVIPPNLMTKLLDYPYPGNVRELENIIKKIVVLNDPGTLHNLESNSQNLSPTIPKKASLKELMNEFEKKILKEALAKYSSTREMAAHLGIDQSNVVRKLKKHNLSLK